jgi:hypothetical protein
MQFLFGGRVGPNFQLPSAGGFFAEGQVDSNQLVAA